MPTARTLALLPLLLVGACSAPSAPTAPAAPTAGRAREFLSPPAETEHDALLAEALPAIRKAQRALRDGDLRTANEVAIRWIDRIREDSRLTLAPARFGALLALGEIANDSGALPAARRAQRRLEHETRHPGQPFTSLVEAQIQEEALIYRELKHLPITSFPPEERRKVTGVYEDLRGKSLENPGASDDTRVGGGLDVDMRDVAGSPQPAEAVTDSRGQKADSELGARLDAAEVMLASGSADRLAGEWPEWFGVEAPDLGPEWTPRILALRARALLGAGRFEEAAREFERALAARGGVEDAESESLRWDLVATRFALDDVRGARDLGRPDPGRANGAATAGGGLSEDERRAAADSALRQGDLRGARDLEQANWEALIADGVSGAALRPQAWRTADLALELEDFRAARDLYEAGFGGSIPARPPFDEEQARALAGLARARHGLSDFRGARDLREMLLAQREATLPPDHPAVQRARRDLAAQRLDSGDLRGARDLEQRVHAAYIRTLPPDHSDITTVEAALVDLDALLAEAAGNSGEQMRGELGPDCIDALLALLPGRRASVESLESAGPAESAELLEARRELAAVLRVLGRTDEARGIEGLLAPGARALGHVEASARRPAQAERKRSRWNYPPVVALPEAVTVVDRREFEIAATIEALSGIDSVSVRQDGRVLAGRPTTDELARDEAGRAAELRLALRIPEGRSSTVISVWVADLRGVASAVSSLVVRFEPTR